MQNKEQHPWSQQYEDMLKELASAYIQYEKTRDLEFYDRAKEIHEDILRTYDVLRINDFLSLINIGRGLVK